MTDFSLTEFLRESNLGVLIKLLFEPDPDEEAETGTDGGRFILGDGTRPER